LNKYVKKFKEAFNIRKEEVKCCKIDKCKLKRKKEKRSIKRTDSYKSINKDTIKHLEDLMTRKVTRELNLN